MRGYMCVCGVCVGVCVCGVCVCVCVYVDICFIFVSFLYLRCFCQFTVYTALEYCGQISDD